MRATLIVLDGPDRVGKFTQTKMLASSLSLVCKVKRVEFPMKDTLTYRPIYWMLENGLAKKLPNLFQIVQFMNKVSFQVKLVFCQWMYDYIIFDRWICSAAVYGKVSGASEKLTAFLSWWFWRPDVTIIMTGAALSADAEDVYERDEKLQVAVRKEYAEWYMMNSKNCCMIDNTGTRNNVHNRILNIIDFNIV